MKVRVDPSAVLITSSPGRVVRHQGVTNRPPCFNYIARDCSNDVIWLEFSDGTVYRYEAPAIADAVAIIVADNHGLTFNRFFRRAVTSLALNASFARVASIPITATIIYTNPPYPGTLPSPCPVYDWPLVWSGFTGAAPPSTATRFPANGVTSNVAWCEVIEAPGGGSLIAYNNGNVGYAGPALVGNLKVEFSNVNDNGGINFCGVFVYQDGGTIAQQYYPGGGAQIINLPVPVADSTVTATNLQMEILVTTSSPIGPPNSIKLEATLS